MILYKVISFGKNEIMCVWKMYILCVYALCVTLQELTSICNCESDVTDGFFLVVYWKVTGGLGTECWYVTLPLQLLAVGSVY